MAQDIPGSVGPTPQPPGFGEGGMPEIDGGRIQFGSRADLSEPAVRLLLQQPHLKPEHRTFLESLRSTPATQLTPDQLAKINQLKQMYQV